MAALREYASVYSKGHVVPCRLDLPEEPPLFLRQLKSLETAYEVTPLLFHAANNLPVLSRLLHCGCGSPIVWA